MLLVDLGRVRLMMEIMSSGPLTSAGKIFAVMTLVGFFLPWVRISPDSLKGNTLELLKNLTQGGKSTGSTFLWMRGEEWREMWGDPVDGFSGYQLSLGARSGTPRMKAQQELASVVLDGKEKRPLLGWLLLIPALAVLGLLGLILEGAPRAFPLVVGLGLGGMYFILRWKIAGAYTDRLLAQLQLGPGWWITIYGMVSLAGVCLWTGFQSRRGRYESKVTIF